MPIKIDPRVNLLVLVALIAIVLVIGLQPGDVSASGGMPQWIGPGQVPEGLEAGEWSGILGRLQTQYIETNILHASDAQVGDIFGIVAFSEDTLVVGAPLEAGGPGDPFPGAGAAYIFHRDLGGGNNWGEAVKLTAGNPQNYGLFGAAVSINGDIVVVAAPLEDGVPSDLMPGAGAVYLFERDQGGAGHWGEAAKLTASFPAANGYFGSSVALEGDTLAVGAYGSGIAFVFERNLGGAGEWGEEAILWAGASPLNNPSNFGYSIALDGDTLVVGARNENDEAGGAYVFERDLGGPGNWGKVQRLSASDPQTEDHFGWSVTADGDVIAVGAPSEDGGPGDPLPETGATYIFERNLGGPNNWGEVIKLIASDSQTYATIGESVFLSEDTLVVGGTGVSSLGTVYIFENSYGGGINWTEIAKLHASNAHEDDRFGGSAAIAENIMIVGATNSSGTGAVFIFQIVPPTPTPTATPTATPTFTPKSTRTSVPTVVPTATPKPTRTAVGTAPATATPKATRTTFPMAAPMDTGSPTPVQQSFLLPRQRPHQFLR